MRSDALANRVRLISAARDVVLLHGPDVALQDVADVAGVGIATLYRHFEDRQSLLSAVVIQSLDSVIEAAANASSLSPTTGPADALASYLHAVIDLRVSAVIPMLLDSLDMHADDIRRARDRSAAAFTKLVDAAHATGELDPGVSVGDLGVLLVRLSRPLPGHWEPNEEIAMAHRHLDLILRGAGWTDLNVRVVGLELDEMYHQTNARRRRHEQG